MSTAAPELNGHAKARPKTDPQLVAERAAVLMARLFAGDHRVMADCCRVGTSTLHDILKAKAKPHELQNFLKNAAKVPSLPGRWLRGDTDDAGPEPEKGPDPTALRVEAFIGAQYGAGTERHVDLNAAAHALGVPVGLLELVYDRHVTPPDELLAAILALPIDPAVSDDWLLKGEGGMYLARKAPPAPAPVGLDLLMELSRKLDASAADLRKASQQIEAEQASRARLAQRIATLEAGIAGIVGEAVERRLKATRAELTRDACEAISSDVEALSRAIGDHRKRVTALEAQAADLPARIAEAEAEALSIEDRAIQGYDQTNAIMVVGFGKHADRLKAVEAALTTLEEETVPNLAERLESLIGAEPEPAQAALEPDACLTQDAWFAVPGLHQQEVPESLRGIMAQQMADLYAALGLDEGREPGTFRVRDLRLYRQWLLSPDGCQRWPAYFRKHGSQG